MHRLAFVMSFLLSLSVGKVAMAKSESFPQGLCIPVLMDCSKQGESTLPELPGAHPGALPGVPSAPSNMVKKSFTNSFGQRNYYVYTPKEIVPGGKANGFFMMLHGCFENAATFGQETGLMKIADKYGFIAVFPEEDYANNVWKCWNWFKPENQAKNSGELSILVGIAQEVLAGYQVNNKNIFVGGLSAGGAMAANVFACHRDLFTGLGVHSGLEYMAATSESEAHAVMSSGSNQDLNITAKKAVECTAGPAKPGAVMVVHGDNDPYVNPINADHIVAQFSSMNDLLDDGVDNNSQSTTLISSKQQSVNGYNFNTLYFGGAGSVRIAQVKVAGLGHAWCGAGQAGQYADAKGPSAAELMWIFLSNYSQR